MPILYLPPFGVGGRSCTLSKTCTPTSIKPWYLRKPKKQILPLNYANISKDLIFRGQVSSQSLLNKQQDEVSQRISTTVESLSQQLEKLNENGIGSASSMIDKVANSTTKISDQFQISQVEEVVSPNFESQVDTLTAPGADILSSTNDTLQQVSGQGTQPGDEVLSGTKDTLQQITSQGVQSVDDVLGGTKEAFQQITGSEAQSIDQMKGALSGTVSGVKSSLSDKVSGVSDQFGQLVASGSDSVSQVTQSVQAQVDNIKQTIVDLYNQSSQSVQNVLDLVTLSVSDSVGGVTNTISEQVTALYQQLPPGVQSLLESAGSGLVQLLQVVKQYPTTSGIVIASLSAIIAISLYRASFAGFSGELSPSESLKLLEELDNSLLVDIRSDELREKEGVPELKRKARKKGVAVPFTSGYSIPKQLSKQLQNPKELQTEILATYIAGLPQINRATSVVLMDSGADGKNAKALARAIYSLYLPNSYVMGSGYQGWEDSQLPIRMDKPNYEVATSEVIQDEIDFIKERTEGVVTTLSNPFVAVGGLLALTSTGYAVLNYDATLQFLGFLGLILTILNRVDKRYSSLDDVGQDAKNFLEFVGGYVQKAGLGIPVQEPSLEQVTETQIPPPTEAAIEEDIEVILPEEKEEVEEEDKEVVQPEQQIQEELLSVPQQEAQEEKLISPVEVVSSEIVAEMFESVQIEQEKQNLQQKDEETEAQAEQKVEMGQNNNVVQDMKGMEISGNEK